MTDPPRRTCPGNDGFHGTLGFQCSNGESLRPTEMSCSHGDRGQGQIMQEKRLDFILMLLRTKFSLPAMD